MTDPASVEAASAYVLAATGGALDGLVHNAGIVRADYTAESVDVWPWFLLTYPKRPTTEVLSDVVPATTFVNVKVLAP